MNHRSPKGFTLMGLSTLGVLLCLESTAYAQSDGWDSNVNGPQAYTEIQLLLDKKAAQAGKVREVFYGQRDGLYKVSPTTVTTFSNSYWTPKLVDYRVSVKASFDSVALAALEKAIKASPELREGDFAYTFKFADGDVKVLVYEEIRPILESMLQGGYAFEARAALLDADQTLLALSDNSLLLRTPSMSGGGLDFSKAPLLETYELAQPPDLLESIDSTTKDKAHEEWAKFLSEPVYRRIPGNLAVFYGLPVDVLKSTVRCRVLRDSDELLLYKKDAK